MRNLGKDDKADRGLIPDNHRNPFSVPDDYFTSLRQDIMAQVKISQASHSPFSTPKPFSTPENYEQQLRDDILLRISEENIKTRVAETGFVVPQGYFDTLSADILSKTGRVPKVLPIKRSAPWYSWAAAASVALVISMFAWFSSEPTDANNNPIQASIDVVPTDDIIQYLAYYSETGDLITLSERMPDRTENFSESLSSEEIEAYLENSI